MSKHEKLKEKRDGLINQYRKLCERIRAESSMCSFQFMVEKRMSIERRLLDVDAAIKKIESEPPAPFCNEKPKSQKPTRRERKRNRIKATPDKDFYMSREWRSLRYKVIEAYGGKCQACGTSAKDGAKIHVDHIKPRSKHPDLALAFSNLQCLCEDCNLGKSNRYETDWR